jgi:hypothetical protein
VRADAAEQEGEGGGESLVLVLRHRVLVERKAISIVQNAVCGTCFRAPAGQGSGAVRATGNFTGERGCRVAEWPEIGDNLGFGRNGAPSVLGFYVNAC